MSLGTTIIPSNRVPQRGNYNFLFTSENCVLPQSIHTSSSQEFRRAVWKSKPSPKRRLGLSGFQRMSAAPSFADFMGQQDKSLSSVLLAFEAAVKRIAEEISGAGLHDLFGRDDAAEFSGGRDEPKKLDVLANDILKSAMSNTGVVAAMASEEDDDIVSVEASEEAKYVAVFDPLDGSSNIDACIPTGTILGVYPYTGSERESVLQPGTNQVAAAYALYSSATMIVLSVGSGVLGFTLDTTSKEFYLSHNIEMPARGQIYSLNDARQFDWPAGLRKYIDAIRQGKGQSGKQYSARYICSLVADFHRNHLRLLYEANPLSFLAEQSGGKGSSGTQQILTMQPESLHQRTPLFLGSQDDIAELESYDDIQQTGNKKYSV